MDELRYYSSGEGGTPSSAEVLEQIQAPISDESLLPGSNRKSWLFTYDLLMNPAILSRYVKGVVPGKIVRLPSFRLVWPFHFPPQGTALPSLERIDSPAPADGVWGIIYETTKRDMTLLERYLHVPNRYHRRAVQTVDRGGQITPASAYVLGVSGGEPLAPSGAYRDELLGIARERGLPDEWLGALERLGATPA